MRKLILGLVMFSAAGFSSAAVCTATMSSAATISPSATPEKCAIAPAGTPAFVQTPFDFQPSANVGLAFGESTTAVAVNAGNIKGKLTYGGSSNGGSTKSCPTAKPVSTTNGYGVAANADKDGCE